MPLPLSRELAIRCAKALAMIRCAIGIGAIVSPRSLLIPWIGRTESDRHSTRLLGRALGGRDLALGLAVLSERAPSAMANLVALGAMADAVDLAATLVDVRRLGKIERVLIGASTAGALVLGAITAASLRGSE